MGLFKRLSNWGFGRKQQPPKVAATIRKCRFEAMEPRQMLDADPVVAGITYLEDDAGEDTTPDYFEVTFEGGSDTTQMTQFVINGDQDGSGDLSDGDMFFDVDANSPGTGQFHGFQFHAGGSQGISAGDVNFLVSDDGLTLTVTLNNFEAGDVLAFTIDVDEVERFKMDKIASGVEFEGTFFQATFVDDHFNLTPQNVAIDAQLSEGFVQPQTGGIFYDEYDQLFSAGAGISGQTLELSGDNESNQANRTAGAIDAYELTPKPVVLSGTVYHDVDHDCDQDALEQGIAGVTINLELFNEQTGQYEFVASTQTDASGNYEFGTQLNLQPGKYRLVEMQPDGYLSVGAEAGTVEGQSSGATFNDINGEPNILADINLTLGGTSAVNYDFCEVKPASISGHVWHDQDNDGIIDAGEERIANVLIRIDRTGGINASGNDPFGGAAPIFVQTDANGFYEATGLPPGTYQITEINNYPNGPNPLDGFIDGKDALGTVGNSPRGQMQNDQFNGVLLTSGESGVQYNFGELKPASISGHVSITTPEGDCVEPGSPEYRGIEGVTIQLMDSQGNLVAETTTNSNGQYEFIGLAPGTYTIVEVQPENYLDGGDHVGSHGGVLSQNDTISQINLGSGSQAVHYDFCEIEPATIKGLVWYDRNNNGVQDNGEEGIGGVRIDLLNADGSPAQILDVNGNVLPSFVFTEADGSYCFENLTAGTYSIVESQPQNYVDGKDVVGSLGGTLSNDRINQVVLLNGQNGENYNFGEIRLASIEGFVFGDTDGDCEFEPTEGDRALANVVINLFDENGDLVATTTTNNEGRYEFSGLLPGEYAVVEITPEGLINGDAHAGKINGVTVGEVSLDRISRIFLSSGDKGTQYDFCEHLPAQLSGHVWHDTNDDGVFEQGSESGINNVVIQLFDDSGALVAETTTNTDGYYEFKNLKAGTYRIVELQPGNYDDGKDSRGNIIGQLPTITPVDANDEFTQITIKGDQIGVNYDFGEILLSSISGIVHTDIDEDCVFDPVDGESGIAGVRMELINGQGVVVAVTTTDANGAYTFDGLRPGNYMVRQSQPDNYFSVGQVVGEIAAGSSVAIDGPGDASIENQIQSIAIQSGMRLVGYNFCEQEGASIHGKVFQDGPAFVTDDGNVPDNYRDLRDGVFTQGEDQGLAGVELQLWYYINPDDGFNPRPVTVADVLPGYYPHLDGLDPSTPITVTTDANGNYTFAGLKAGNYIVFETQPDNYVDSNDTVGTTTGLAFNSSGVAAQAQSGLLQQFSVNQLLDSLANIRVNSGQSSFQNNFSEVLAREEPDNPRPPQDPPQFNPLGGGPLNRPAYIGVGLAGAQPLSNVQILGGVRIFATDGLDPYTWHLSVVNAGAPRGEQSTIVEGNSIWLNASFVGEHDWTRYDMDRVRWTFTTSQDDDDDYMVDRRYTVFGNAEGIPVVGDFDGDGFDEIGVFNEGYWMIDINGNGRWDQDDMVAKLGGYDDLPVTGDWDGDGKDDIGIYGPQWDGDPEAITREPGLPDFANRPATRPKNIPPMQPEATDGARVMRLTSHGKSRADLIDHVFGYGDHDHIPVVGDWNGDGIRTIGLYRAGTWRIDLNGDGRLNEHDVQIAFGQEGDRPVVGDFNGDGVEEIGVYRNGKWIIDINNNREMDAHDRVFEMGGASDQPVAGDWDGDGKDEPGLYHSGEVVNNQFNDLN